MWSKTANFLIVRVKIQKHRGFTFPVPLWIVDDLFEAFAGLTWVGENVIKLVPSPREERARKHMRWIKTISLSGFVTVTHDVFDDLRRHKGLDFVDVEAGEIQVKVHLR